MFRVCAKSCLDMRNIKILFHGTKRHDHCSFQTLISVWINGMNCCCYTYTRPVSVSVSILKKRKPLAFRRCFQTSFQYHECWYLCRQSSRAYHQWIRGSWSHREGHCILARQKSLHICSDDPQTRGDLGRCVKIYSSKEFVSWHIRTVQHVPHLSVVNISDLNNLP